MGNRISVRWAILFDPVHWFRKYTHEGDHSPGHHQQHLQRYGFKVYFGNRSGAVDLGFTAGRRFRKLVYLLVVGVMIRKVYTFGGKSRQGGGFRIKLQTTTYQLYEDKLYHFIPVIFKGCIRNGAI